MKKALLFLTISILFTSIAYSQCAANTASGPTCTRSDYYYGEILPNSGCGAFTSASGYGPGYYFRMPVLQGGCYTITTCGAGIDTQIGCFQGVANTGPFAYNDDNGPGCSGTAASVDFVSSFTDYTRVDVRQYNCLPGGSSSITVNVRQNNNLSFTSAGTDMCQGEVRSLAALPTPVVAAAQPGSGDLGTFTGTGVSGTNFTAPAPVGNSAVYTITYTFGYCSTTQNITVYHQPSVSNAGLNYDEACGSTTTTLSANLPAFGTGTWSVVSGAGTITNSTNPSSTVTGLVPGTSSTFRWTITNGPCAASISDVTVTVPIAPSVGATVSPSSTVCLGQDVTFNGTGAFIYSWSGGVFNNAPFTTVTPGSATYTVTGTDLSGCSATATQTIMVNSLPSVTATATANDSVCVGGSFTLNGGGATSYTWSGGVTNGVANTAVSAGTTTYTVTGTDANLCSATSTINIVKLALPTVGTSATPGTTVCSGSDLTLNGTGAATYSWSGGVTNGVAFPALGPGTYTVTGSTAFGCSNTSTISIAVNTSPTVGSSASPSNVVCDGDSIILSGSGASTYVWSGGVTDGAEFPADIATTTYTVTGTAVNGCTATATQSLTVNSLPSVGSTVSPSAIVCEGSNVTLSGSGAVSYSWSGGVTDATAFPAMSSITYTVTGTDANNCSNTSTQTITINTLPVVGFDFSTDSVCTTYGLINLTGSSPAGGTYSGTNVSGTTFDPQGLGLGYYVITYSFTDGNTCTNTATDSILVSGCLGISELNEGDLNLYPNPTTGKFYLSIMNEVTGDVNIYIVDMQGKMVYQSVVNKSNSDFVKEIDILEEAPGVYFLNVLFDEGQKITKRIIKH